MIAEQLAGIAAQAYQHMAPWSAEQFRETLARADSLLARQGDAFVLGVVQFDTAEILAVASAPRTQRQGHARQAFAQFAEQAAQRGAERILLDVSEHNRAAISFYESLGFSQVGRRKGYYRTPGQPLADALVMQSPIFHPN